MKIQKICLPENCRIICVSDIHAHCDDFEALLKDCRYDAEKDYLFILGDILEKGKQNVKTLRFVQNLCKNPKAVCIQGNNDTMCLRMAFADTQEEFLRRLECRPYNVFVEMAESMEISGFATDFEEKRQAVVSAFASELEFIRNMPLAVETDGHIFVHAGVENRPDWENSAEEYVQSASWYIREKHCLDKFVVVGHYPCYNFARSKNSNLPIVDFEKKMIDIDGGCEVKWAGQLNALIIEKQGGNYSYSTVFKPLVPERRVIKDSAPDGHYTYLDVEKSDLEIISSDGEFLLVKNRFDGSVGKIPARCTGEWGGKLHGWINLNAFLSVSKGEKFFVYGEIGEFFFGLAQDGQMGLVDKSCIE